MPPLRNRKYNWRFGALVRCRREDAGLNLYPFGEWHRFRCVHDSSLSAHQSDGNRLVALTLTNTLVKLAQKRVLGEIALDENLFPPSLGLLLLFAGLTHLRDFGIRQADDKAIWEWAKAKR